MVIYTLLVNYFTFNCNIYHNILYGTHVNKTYMYIHIYIIHVDICFTLINSVYVHNVYNTIRYTYLYNFTITHFTIYSNPTYL